MRNRDIVTKLNPDNSQKNYLLEYMQRLESKMDVLNNQFDDKLKYDQGKNEQIQQLHKLAYSFRGDLLKKAMEPLVNELIDFVGILEQEKNDWIAQMSIINAEHKAEDDNNLKMKMLEKIARSHFTIEKDINQMLAKFGVLPITSKQGDKYDANMHKIQLTTTVEAKTRLAGKIHKSIKSGYWWHEKVHKNEIVQVYIYENEVV